MKKLITLLIIVSVTAAIVLFPNLYYSKADEGIKDYHRQEDYNLNRVENIDLQKKLDILTDENSVYIDKTTNDTTENDWEIVAEMVNQIVELLQIKIDETEVAKTAMENGVKSMQVINSSSYNVYSVDLKIVQTYTDKYDFTIVFDANEKMILYTEVLYLEEEKYEQDSNILNNNIKKYYGEFTEWNFEYLGYGKILNVGSQKEINYILRKLDLQMEEDYVSEVQRYNFNQEN